MVLDLDKTLIHGDSVVAFSEVLMKRGMLNSDFWIKNEILDRDGHYFSTLKKYEIHQAFYNANSNLKKDLLDEFLIRPEVRQINIVIEHVNNFCSNGYKVLITTASLDFLVHPILKLNKINFDFLHFTSFINLSQGAIIGKVNNSGIVKLQSLKDHFNIFGFPNDLVVFSDHFSDLPLLMLGQKSFVVKNKLNKTDDWSNYFEFNVIWH